MSDHNERIHNQDAALADYFDDLLMMPDISSKSSKQERNLKLVHSKPAEECVVETTVNGLATDEPVETIIKLDSFDDGGADINLPQNKAAPELQQETEFVEGVDTIKLDKPVILGDEDYNDGRPEWAINSFKVVVFVINNMKFAIPKFATNGQQTFSNELKTVANQPAWVMGLLVESDSFIAAVDTRHLLLNMPPKDINSVTYTELVLLANSRWGLAVDGLSEELVIQSNNVNWRKDAVKRTWLCGTDVKQQLTIIEPKNLFTINE